MDNDKSTLFLLQLVKYSSLRLASVPANFGHQQSFALEKAAIKQNNCSSWHLLNSCFYSPAFRAFRGQGGEVGMSRCQMI